MARCLRAHTTVAENLSFVSSTYIARTQQMIALTAGDPTPLASIGTYPQGHKSPHPNAHMHMIKIIKINIMRET